MTEVQLTHIGGPTVLLEVEGWRILTDPTFDPAGGSYRFGLGTGSRKLAGPAVSAAEIGEVDVVYGVTAQALRARTVVTTASAEESTARPAASRLSSCWSWLSKWRLSCVLVQGESPICVSCSQRSTTSASGQWSVLSASWYWASLGAREKIVV